MAHIDQVFAFIKQGSPPLGAQLSQLMLGRPKTPQEPPHSHRANAYSSGAPKMWQDSRAKTRSILSAPQLSL